jgi:hypothetical protein
MGQLQLESDDGSYCNKIRDLLLYSRRCTCVKRNLPGANVCSCVCSKRQLYMCQHFAQQTTAVHVSALRTANSNLPKELNVYFCLPVMPCILNAMSDRSNINNSHQC